MAKEKGAIGGLTLGQAIDELGRLQAIVAGYTAREKLLKAYVADCGAGAYEGDLFRATVSVYDQHRLDMEAVRAKLSPQFIAAHTTVTPVTKVQVKARNDINVIIAA